MTDIAKCTGNNCPKKESCMRYMAPSGTWQSWSDFDKRQKNGECEHYLGPKDIVVLNKI